MSLHWVQDSNSKYEVSSKEHLLQLMHGGTLYTDTGTPPTSYPAGSYKQTTDIDLADVHSYITYGIELVNGEYDGGNFSISNWSYLGIFTTDPLNTPSNYIGLFTKATNSTLKNIRLTGVWYAYDSFREAGFLSCHTSGGIIMNCEGDFDVGTKIGPGPIVDPETYVYMGTMIARVLSAQVSGLTVRGTVEMTESTYSSSVAAGVIAQVHTNQSLTNVRNLATFPTGIKATVSGGVIGFTLYCLTTTNLLCAMKGDIGVDNSTSGGVIGYIKVQTNDGLNDNFINSMEGNITGRFAGGIVGNVTRRDPYVGTFTRFINYMTGDITFVSVHAGSASGICSRTYLATVTDSIIAMNGNVPDAAGEIVGGSISLTVDTTFGLTFTTNSGTTTTSLTGYLYDSTFTDLPYTDLTTTDTDGNYYNWDFVFGNLSGKPAYSAYTHLSFHKGGVSYPFETSFTLLESNTVFYATYSNADLNTTYTDGSLVVLESDATTVYNYAGTIVIFPAALTILPRPVNMIVGLAGITGAIGYRLTYQTPSGSEITAVSGFTSLQQNIKSLEPDTLYTVRLYTDTGTGYQFQAELQSTTLSDTVSNYNIQDFLEGSTYDLVGINGTTKGVILARMSELFSTGDILDITSFDSKDRKVKFVNTGDSSVAEDSLLIPFDENSGASQSITLTLDDNSTAVVSYDETLNEIEVESVTHAVGDQFILDGKKVKVIEY